MKQKIDNKKISLEEAENLIASGTGVKSVLNRVKNKADQAFLTLKYSDIPECRCGRQGEDEHTCPYAVEINNNLKLCNCCVECSNQCAMDI